MPEDVDESVIRCFCCDKWVRLRATEIVRTGERGDEESWCILCIREVDEYTVSIEQPQLAPPPDLDLEGENYD